MNGQKNAPQNRIEDDEDGSMILEEEIDENYEPTQEEIIEYAQFLGMDLQKDKEFFYIAREGLKAPLPDIWKPAKNRNGDIYYINIDTKKTQWEHPCDEYYKKLFQDVKKKKPDSNSKVAAKATSKFKSNLPIANNASLLTKSPLPLIKEVGSQQRLDTGGSSENQNTLSLNNPDFSGDTSPNNKQSKKAAEKSNPSQSQKLGSILNDLKDDFVNTDDFSKIDKEYEDKLVAYKKEKDTEAKDLAEQNETLKSEHEDTLATKLKNELESFKTKLMDKVKSSNKSLAEEKKKINQNVILEFKNETELAIKKINQDHLNAKRKIELQEAREIDKAMEGEEELIIKEYESKIMELARAKKDVEREQLRFHDTKEQKARQLERDIEEEKDNIAEGYRKQLLEFEKKELANQRVEVENYKNKIRAQIGEEKSALAIAENQRKSLALAKESEFKEEYDKKLDLGKKDIDDDIAIRLREYEESERLKKDKLVQLHKENEFKLEKDKKQMVYQGEIEKLVGNYRRRLDTYERQLREKFDAEKQLIEQENNLVLERHRNDVENIRTNISNKEDILFQIKKTQDKNDEVNREIMELNKKSDQQKRESEQLQRKLENLRNRQKAQSQAAAVAAMTKIKDLEAKIQESEKQIKNLNKPQVIIQSDLKTPQQKLSKTLPVSTTAKSNTSFVKVMDEIEEIKSILMTKTDEKTKISPIIMTPKKMLSSKLTSPTTLKSILSDKGHLLTKSKFNMHQDAYEKWISTYTIELDHIADIKGKIQECKNILAKRQSGLIQDQEKLKRHLQDFKVSLDKSLLKKNGLKKLKASLDEKIHKINQTMYELREADIQLEMKERLLATLGHSIRRMNVDGYDTDYVSNIYTRYQDIDIKIPNLAEEKDSKFYEAWKDIVENQITMENDLSGSEINLDLKLQQTVSSEKLSSPQFKTNVFQKRLEAFLSPKSSKNNMDYSYDNLMKVLDLQSKSEVIAPDTNSFKRHFTEAQEERAKIQTMFSNHSDWLKDVKQKLNHRLYDKTSVNSSRSTLMSQNLMF